MSPKHANHPFSAASTAVVVKPKTLQRVLSGAVFSERNYACLCLCLHPHREPRASFVISNFAPARLINFSVFVREIPFYF